MKTLLLSWFIGASAVAASEIKFNRDILPVLSENCFFCHGPDKANQAADLRLDLRDAAIESRAIVPGNSADSLAIQRILSTDPDDIMPPADSHRTLSEREKELLVQWIDEGAPYQKHWSFIPVDHEAEVPTAESSAIDNPIDRIVFTGLESLDLKPQPEAQKTFLLRRVYFDLIGLPPTPAEVTAFLNDDSENAYERVVDELLSRREYGERMAVHWLDLARYADSYGYQVDRDRPVWAWRDWVIESFNNNLPYDDFVTYQLAGDLLPNPTQEQRLATAFNRLHQQKAEGGSVEEEFRVEYICDRVNTFGTAFLGLTLECSRCHDHKYDPISQKEYFQLFAFFDDIDESGLYPYFGKSVPTPALKLSSPDQKAKIQALEDQTDQLIRQLIVERKSSSEDELQTWFESNPDLAVRLAKAEAMDLKPETEERGRLFDGDAETATAIGAVSRHDPFSVSFSAWTPKHHERAVICHYSGAWTDGGSRGWELLSLNGQLRFSLIHFWPGNAISIETNKPFPLDQWTQISLTYDGSSQAKGLKIYVDGKLAESTIVRDKLDRFIQFPDFPENKRPAGIRWGARERDRGFKGGRVDQAVYYPQELHSIEVTAINDDSFLARLQDKAFGSLDSHERAFIREAHLAQQHSADQSTMETLTAARQAHAKAIESIPEIMTMVELPEPKQAYLLERGAYDARGEAVIPQTPKALSLLPDDFPTNRLGLAMWLTDPDHPLFARVAVNRFWMLCFGRGLVGTAEDFGLQGEQPQYQELLDHLASDFIANEWDVKALMRKIVTSQTYRQQSIADQSIMRDDPSNRLLARGPSHRLPAEMIRDGILAASGLLVEKNGGSSVRPYDLSEAFININVPKNNGVYQRSLYTYWKLRAPSPVMMAFDAVKRDVCSAKRQTSNTPLQSLVLLNGPQFVEAARVAGSNAWQEENGKLADIIRNLSLRFIGREPDSVEIEILSELFQEQKELFEANPESADALLAVGHQAKQDNIEPADHAAVTVLAQTLINFDEYVMKR
ncbi:MAG: DUF1553 domain-containing protein [Verrucomicrobiota bacterium]